MSNQEELRASLEDLCGIVSLSDVCDLLKLLEAALAEARAEGEIAGLEWIMKVEGDGSGMLPVDEWTVQSRIEELKGKQP